jgi:hypothetical protein
VKHPTGYAGLPFEKRREGSAVVTEYEEGLLVGLLIGEGHFGGDGRQPQITLRMHVRHEAMFRWLERTFPGGKLYGPYHHDGRHYYQWMVRGTYLRDTLLPILERRISPAIDGHSYERIQGMRQQYAGRLNRPDAGAGSADVTPTPPGASPAP